MVGFCLWGGFYKSQGLNANSQSDTLCFRWIPTDLIADRSVDGSIESVATSGWLNGTQINRRATQITESIQTKCPDFWMTPLEAAKQHGDLLEVWAQERGDYRED